MYPLPLMSMTAEAAYSYIPDSAVDCYLRTHVSTARSRIPFARHALLELRSYATGKRRRLSTGQFILPLCSPTNDDEKLAKLVALGDVVAARVNRWVADDWGAQLGYQKVLILGDYPRAYIDSNITHEAKSWLDEYASGMYFHIGDRIAFPQDELAVHFHFRWAGRMSDD
ncbi:hypothetical protein [Methylorubrum extorquens]